jgi:hypothetical protein
VEGFRLDWRCCWFGAGAGPGEYMSLLDRWIYVRLKINYEDAGLARWVPVIYLTDRNFLGLGVSTGCYLVENRAFGSEFGGSGSGSYVCVLADYTFIIQQFLDPGIFWFAGCYYERGKWW